MPFSITAPSPDFTAAAPVAARPELSPVPEQRIRRCIAALLASLLAVEQASAGGQAPPATNENARPAAVVPPADSAPPQVSENWARPVVPSSTAIRRAARESLIEEREAELAARKAAAIPERYTMSSAPTLNREQRMERAFDAAKIPGCFQKNALKHQSTFIFGGLLAIPFIPIAALRGKCN